MTHLKNRDYFKLFINHTNEKKVTLIKLIEIIKPNKSKSFLDCGCGSGEYTIPLSNLFGKTIAFDVIDKITENLNGKINVKFVKSSLEDIKLVDKFDVILLSHVIFHTDETKWISILKKLLKSLSPDGKIIIITHAIGSEWIEFMKEFCHKVSLRCPEGGKRIKDMLEKLKLNYKLHEIETKITSKSVDSMYNLCAFFFADKKNEYFKLEKEVKDYLERFKKNNELVIQGKQSIFEIDNKPEHK